MRLDSRNSARSPRSVCPEARRDMVESAVRQTLFNTIRGNPVDTARSRASWVQSLERLGGTPPAGWPGTATAAVRH